MLAVIILTFNEALHLERALQSVTPFAKEVFVVDSYSTDDTLAIARRYGAHILQNPFVNQAKQFQWALDHAPITAEWVMRLDADEIVENDLAATIARGLGDLPAEVTGIILNRKTIFRGQWIKHGGRYPLMLLRIWRRGKAHIEDRWMDEHIVLTEGRAVIFQGGFADWNLNDLTFFTDKHNKYATREAVEVINQRHGLFVTDQRFGGPATARQAALKRVVKEKIYNRLPFELAAFGYFLYRYVIQIGFLDGRDGLVYHFLQGLWYRYLVGAKVREFEFSLAGIEDKEKMKRELSRLTGLRLSESE